MPALISAFRTDTRPVLRSSRPAPVAAAPASRALPADPGREEWLSAALRRLAVVEARAAASARRETPSAPARRQLVTAAQLLDIIERETAARGATERMALGGRTLEPREPDAAGCNWSPSAIVIRLHGYVGPQSFRALEEAMSVALRRYNLVPG